MPLQDELTTARKEILDAFNYQTPNGFFQRHLSEFEIAALSMLYRKTAAGGTQLSDATINAIATAVAHQLNKPILVADNAGTTLPYFVVADKPATFRGVSFQVLPSRETSADYWVLLFDQSSGVPQGAPAVKAGLIGQGITEGNGHETEIYQLGVEFKKGILCAISLESNRYVAPTASELFISIAYHGESTIQPPVAPDAIGLSVGGEMVVIALSSLEQTYVVGF